MFNQLCHICEYVLSYDWETGLHEDDVMATFRHFVLFVLVASVSNYLHFIVYNKRFSLSYYTPPYNNLAQAWPRERFCWLFLISKLHQTPPPLHIHKTVFLEQASSVKKHKSQMDISHSPNLVLILILLGFATKLEFLTVRKVTTNFHSNKCDVFPIISLVFSAGSVCYWKRFFGLWII